MPVLSFLMLDQLVQVSCDDGALQDLVLADLGAMSVPSSDRAAELHYVITSAENNGYAVSCRGQPAITLADEADLLFRLEKDLTVALQMLRPDLLFIHAAALAKDGMVCLLVGESGHGKSTTAWGLLHHGFRYLSDELGPLDLRSMQVLPYPHALCLKQPPPPSYPLPVGSLDLGDTLHVPVPLLPCATAGPCELGAVLFVRYRDDLDAPVLHPMTAAQASARLYVSTLNALAHPAHGVDAVVRVAASVPCYSLACTDLSSTCEMVGRILAAGAAQPTALSDP
jgi:hypothetical protein